MVASIYTPPDPKKEVAKSLIPTIPDNNAGPEPAIDLARFRPTYQKAHSDIARLPGGPNPYQADQGTSALIGMFGQEYTKRTGGQKAKNADIEQFLGSSLTPDYAFGVVTGQDPNGLASRAVQNYFMANPGILGEADIALQKKEQDLKDRTAALDEELGAMYDQLGAFREQSIRQDFGNQRRRLTETQQSLGRLDQPLASIPEAELGGQEETAVSNMRDALMGNQIAGKLSNFQLAEQLRRQDIATGEQAREFDVNTAEGRMALNRKEADNYTTRILTMDLARMKADAEGESKKMTSRDWADIGASVGLSLIPVVGPALGTSYAAWRAKQKADANSPNKNKSNSDNPSSVDSAPHT